MIAYFLQWLPWIGSPRIAFEYHFYPESRDHRALQRDRAAKHLELAGPPADILRSLRCATLAVVGVSYAVVVVWAFVFFYPVLAGTHVTWETWHARMWLRRWII